MMTTARMAAAVAAVGLMLGVSAMPASARGGGHGGNFDRGGFTSRAKPAERSEEQGLPGRDGFGEGSSGRAPARGTRRGRRGHGAPVQS